MKFESALNDLRGESRGDLGQFNPHDFLTKHAKSCQSAIFLGLDVRKNPICRPKGLRRYENLKC